MTNDQQMLPSLEYLFHPQISNVINDHIRKHS